VGAAGDHRLGLSVHSQMQPALLLAHVFQQLCASGWGARQWWEGRVGSNPTGGLGPNLSEICRFVERHAPGNVI